MRLIRRTMSRNPRAREILDPSRFPHQRLDSSRRDHRKRRERKEQENHLKGSHNPRRHPHPRLLHQLLLTLLHPKQGEVVIPIEKRSPGTIKKQCVPYTLPSGCANGNSCPFQHANDPVTKKPVAPSPEDVKRYQAALKRNPSLADPKAAPSSGANEPSSSVPIIKMIRVSYPRRVRRGTGSRAIGASRGTSP